MNENILGKRIKLLREELGLNQIQLAEKLMLSSSASISQYESGDRVPSDDIKIKMSQLFNVSIDYLLGKSDNKNGDSQYKHLGNTRIGMVAEKMSKMSDEDLKKFDALIDMWLKEDRK